MTIEICRRVGLIIIYIVAGSLSGCFIDSDDPQSPQILSEPQIEYIGPVTQVRGLTLETDIDSRLILELTDGAGHNLTIEYPEYAQLHANMPILGLRSARTYDVTVTVQSRFGGISSWEGLLQITNGPLPDFAPDISVLTKDLSRAEPGYTLFSFARRGESSFSDAGAIIIVDSDGEVVWLLDQGPGSQETEQLPGGRLLSLHPDRNLISEFDMAGNIVAAWCASAEEDCSLTAASPGKTTWVKTPDFHHEVELTEDGTYLSLTRNDVEVAGFPTDPFDETVTDTVFVQDKGVVEFAADGTLLKTWNFTDILKPTRISYSSTNGLPNRAANWNHSNAAYHDVRDDSIVVSLRHQDAVVKFSRDTSELIWILGTHANWEGFEQYLLFPQNFSDWHYAQHAPELTPQGTILLFDNGANYRASPFTGEPLTEAVNNYSRAIEYEIDEQAMTVSRVWEYGLAQGGEQLMAPIVGDADRMPETGNVLVTFGAICTKDGMPHDVISECRSHARVIEVVHDENADEVFDLLIDDPDPDSKGIIVYRSERLLSLYGDTGVLVTSD